MAEAYTAPNSTQLMTWKQDLSDRRCLGHHGHVTALQYTFACPGGADTLQGSLVCPVDERVPALEPGRLVTAVRGGHTVWTGTMNEPSPSSGGTGWDFTAQGAGQLAANFLAIYTSTWPAGEPDQPINNAITRGLKWVNPGVGSPSGIWLGQAVDSAAQTVADILNLVCTRGGLTWYVNSQPGGPQGNSLSVFALPSQVNRLLVCNTPVARTLDGNINTIYIRYEVSADDATSGAAAVYATTVVTNAADIAAHGPQETFIDLSDVGVMTAGQAQAVGNFSLSVYQRVTFSGPFQVMPGQLLTTGGTPIDPGTDQAGTVVRLITTDLGYGGEVTEQYPVTFIVGGYEWDDQQQIATVTPFQSLFQSLSDILSMENTVLTPLDTTTTS